MGSFAGYTYTYKCMYMYVPCLSIKNEIKYANKNKNKFTLVIKLYFEKNLLNVLILTKLDRQ